jgi:hypothetical protein
LSGGDATLIISRQEIAALVCEEAEVRLGAK